MSPLERFAGASPDSWGRFDTVGRTIYAADSPLTAYLEMLAPYRTIVSDTKRALLPAATAMGLSLEAYWNAILDEWGEQGNMHAMWIPRTFREGRALYSLVLPEGWWVDVSSADTLSALDDIFPAGITDATATTTRNFTLADLASDNRSLTTMIASELRHNVRLDDGSLPLGVRFLSKHGQPSGTSDVCWAYWQRDVDHGKREPARESGSQPIELDDRDLVEAQRLCKIRMR